MTVRIAPSVLSADLGRLAEQIARCEKEGGADWLHVDVMDGHFVPNLTFGAKMIETLKRLSRLPLDVHLMVVEPERYIKDFAAAGASVLTVHVEAAPHLNRQIARIKEAGCRAGAALNPGTSLSTVEEVVRDLDLLLVMSVNPGFGGQRYILSINDKIRRARELLDRSRSSALLEVDGGINSETICNAWRNGANVFVAGEAVFGEKDPLAAIGRLRSVCYEAV